MAWGHNWLPNPLAGLQNVNRVVQVERVCTLFDSNSRGTDLRRYSLDPATLIRKQTKRLQYLRTPIADLGVVKRPARLCDVQHSSR